MTLSLRTATRSDLDAVLPWIKDQCSLVMWAGPGLSYPPSRESFWKSIGASPQNTFCLVSTAGEMAGFGQALTPARGIVHLARLIVDPRMRGKGYGRILCLRLMETSRSRQSVRRFTLNVCRDNDAAFRLYRSLGFQRNVERDSGPLVAMHLLTADRTEPRHPD
jgi:ribosomal protein S18 acetylase RimI-like enzyme